VRDNAAARTATTPNVGSFAIAIVLAAAVAAGILVAQLLIQPPASDLRTLAVYMSISSVVTVIGGVLGVLAADSVGVLTLRAKVAVSGLIGALVGLFNVLIVSKLMFVSTGHDLRLLIALIIVSATISLGFSMWVASTVTRRIELVASGVRTLALGQYQRRVNAVGQDEVARLATDVNVLADRLEAAEAQRAALEQERRDFTIAISHDLRTPLASIRAMAEALDDGVVTSVDEVHRYHSTIRREVERLGRMIDDLFQLSQMDTGSLPVNRQTVAIEEVAAEVVDAMQAQAAARGIALSLHVDEDVPMVPLDGALLERAIRNLVSNALEYTPEDGKVTVSVLRDGTGLALRVQDTGQGIRPEDLPRVWDRFFRAERSRTRMSTSSDGAGLGLAIVRGIAEAHGGSVSAQSAPQQGAAFTIRLPVT
jgi:signal transduction histidine kinase